MEQEVEVNLEFLKPLEKYKTEKPYRLFVGLPDASHGFPVSNAETENVRVHLHNIRGREDEYDVDEHGFQCIRHTHEFSSWDDAEAIDKKYLPQVEKSIRENVADAQRVVVYNWRIRADMKDVDPESLISPRQIQDKSFTLLPAQIVHTDCTDYSLRNRTHKFLGAEAETLLKGRVRMVSFWRSLEHEVYDRPMVFCDGRSVRWDNMVAVDQVFRGNVAEVYYPTYHPTFKWHYWNRMSKEDALLLKSWDTSNNYPSRACPHASCYMPAEVLPEHYHPRRSIECRALIFS